MNLSSVFLASAPRPLVSPASSLPGQGRLRAQPRPGLSRDDISMSAATGAPKQWGLEGVSVGDVFGTRMLGIRDTVQRA